MSVSWRPVGQQTSLAGFDVALDEFEGPLDLLLHLIDQQGLDLSGVSVMAVTDQFIAYARELGERFADAASEFLLIGTQLALLKSRAMLPRPEPDPEDELTADELAARLRLYAAFKAVAAEFDDWQRSGRRSLIRVAAPVIAQPPVEPGAGDLEGLVAAVEALLAEHRPSDLGVDPPTLRYRVADKIREVTAVVRSHGSVEFGRLAAQCADRAELIVTFVAILHLVFQREITVEQRRRFGPITLRGTRARD